ncbi:MAG: LysM peptidoglycan-binding domain-containing protein [Spirochaetota bacterium]
MAVNTKNSSKTGAKTSAQKKGASKQAKKPEKKASSKTVVKSGAAQKTAIDKNSTETSKAFDKKIDELAQKSASVQKQNEKSKSSMKTYIGILVILIAAVLVYFLYPKGKPATVKDQAIPKEPAAPAPEAKAIEPKTEAAKPKTGDVIIYKVKYKDQLTEISKQQYGSFKEWKRIYEANKDKIKNPNLIYPGQEFIIPKIEK